MDRILSSSEMKYCDDRRISTGLPSLVLMERAALSVLKVLRQERIDTSNCVILCGPGNNGADGIAIARLLAEEGERPLLVLCGNPDSYTEQVKAQLLAASLYDIPQAEDFDPGGCTLIVDALFGIGLSRNVQGRFSGLIEKANASSAVRIAVDISSGLNADNGAVMGIAFKADITVTFAAAKVGHFAGEGLSYSGRLFVEPVGIPIPDIPETGSGYALTDSDLHCLPRRDRTGHKGTFGKVLVIAGNDKICGAAYFCAAACLKTGVGMVMVYTHENNRTPLFSLLPETLMKTYDETDSFESLIPALSWCDACVIGSGLGTSEQSLRLLKRFLRENKKPAVFDADALNLFAENEELYAYLTCPAVFTPHISEMSRLTGLSSSEIKNNALLIAKEFAKKRKVVCVLKDASTITAYPDGRVYINTSGSDALSTAGSGDVLSGILGAFLVRYKKAVPCAEACAVFFHGRVGEAAGENASKSGTTAMSLIGLLPKCAAVLD